MADASLHDSAEPATKDEQLAAVKSELAGVKSELADVKAELAGVKGQLKQMEAHIVALRYARFMREREAIRRSAACFHGSCNRSGLMQGSLC